MFGGPMVLATPTLRSRHLDPCTYTHTHIYIEIYTYSKSVEEPVFSASPALEVMFLLCKIYSVMALGMYKASACLDVIASCEPVVDLDSFNK